MRAKWRDLLFVAGISLATIRNVTVNAVAQPIILYDGVCGLCNRTVQFVLRHDHDAIFRFAALQSSFAAKLLARHGADPSDLNTMYVVLNCNPAKQNQNNADNEVLLARSDAVLYILRQLKGFCGMSARLLRWIPRPVRDWSYGIVAHYRYRIFGRYDTCPVPNEATRTRFLNL